ncbi:MAG TPA: GDSL-type esterase/lipase family protein [Bryobacteraceae bacterium]|nr:GDSL-type esterase/lipase family protein [Bryobacteraceae bacterium]
MGDSVTYGVRPDGRVLPEDVFPFLIERTLRSEGIPARVINAGVPGNTTEDVLKRLERDVLAHKPHVVILMIGINDGAYVDPGPKARTEPRVPLPRFRENVRTIIGRLRAAGSKVLLVTPNPISKRYIYSTFGYYGNHEITGTQQPYVQALIEMGRALAVPVIDVFGEWRREGALDQYLVDGVHPNAAGHSKIAERLLPQLRRLIRGAIVPIRSTQATERLPNLGRELAMRPKVWWNRGSDG